MSLNIEALTDDDGEFPTSAVQYVVLTPDGKVHVNGDQEWVRDGRALDHYRGGTTLCRDLTITYGPWRDASVVQPEAMADDYREQLHRKTAIVIELGRHARAQLARLRDPARSSTEALAALDELATRLIGIEGEPRG